MTFHRNLMLKLIHMDFKMHKNVIFQLFSTYPQLFLWFWHVSLKCLHRIWYICKLKYITLHEISIKHLKITKIYIYTKFYRNILIKDVKVTKIIEGKYYISNWNIILFIFWFAKLSTFIKKFGWNLSELLK